MPRSLRLLVVGRLLLLLRQRRVLHLQGARRSRRDGAEIRRSRICHGGGDRLSYLGVGLGVEPVGHLGRVVLWFRQILLDRRRLIAEPPIITRRTKQLREALQRRAEVARPPPHL